MHSVFATNTKYNFLNYKIPLIYMTKKPIFSRKTKFRPKKRISEKISYICTVRATEANDQPCKIGRAENTAER